MSNLTLKYIENIFSRGRIEVLIQSVAIVIIF